MARNEALQVIENRRSIRTFTEQEVTESDIQTLLTAANQAPSAHNQQSWRFFVIRGDKKRELAELVTRRAAEFPRPTAALLRMGAKSILSAPVVIAVSNTGELIRRGGELFQMEAEQVRDFFRVMEIQSSAAAVENLLLAATSIGLSSVWLGVLILIQREVLDFLGMPEGEFMAVVPVGYAQREKSGPHKRGVGMVVTELG